jgi:hypothetical protein
VCYNPETHNRKEQSVRITRQHVKRALEVTTIPVIIFILGASLGLVIGFILAWMLCLKLLAILVLIPLGPGGW